MSGNRIMTNAERNSDEFLRRVTDVIMAQVMVDVGLTPAGRMRRRLRRAQARLDAFKAAHLEVPT